MDDEMGVQYTGGQLEFWVAAFVLLVLCSEALRWAGPRLARWWQARKGRVG